MAVDVTVIVMAYCWKVGETKVPCARNKVTALLICMLNSGTL